MDKYWHKKKLLAKELKLARIRNELTQVELAKKLNKTQSFVNKYETAERRLDIVEFVIICKILGVKEQEILKVIK